MDAFTEPAIERITLIKSARVGYTKIINNAIAYFIHQDPSSILVVQPTVDDAKGYSKDEISPMLRDTPVLAGLVADPKSRDSGNTIEKKSFPGGTLTLIGANSARGFRRLTARAVFFDEVDGYPPTAGQEGDQISLGIKRTDTFWNRKIALGSTPTIKGASRIEASYEESDGGRFYVPCPHCETMQVLWWRNLKWAEPKDAHFVCEECGTEIEHKYKRWMVERGEWRGKHWKYADRFEFDDGFSGHIGFHIWAAYSYSPNAAWGKLVKEFLDAKRDPERLKTFVNTVLGETWEDDAGERPEWTSLLARCEPYTPRVVPRDGLLLVAGVDTQDDRLAVTVKAYGRDEESWLIYYAELYGDPARPEVWTQLDTVLDYPFPHQSGSTIRIAAMAVDSGGHRTQEVYNYCRKHRARHVIATKGASTPNKPILSKPSAVDVNYSGTIVKNGVQLWTIGVDTAKSLIYSRLKIMDGPGRMHWYIGADEEYFQQLTAEKMVTRFTKGFPKREWIKTRPRNEALDCEVLCYVAAMYAGLQRIDWDDLEMNVVPAEVKEVAQAVVSQRQRQWLERPKGWLR